MIVRGTVGPNAPPRRSLPVPSPRARARLGLRLVKGLRPPQLLILVLEPPEARLCRAHLRLRAVATPPRRAFPRARGASPLCPPLYPPLCQLRVLGAPQLVICGAELSRDVIRRFGACMEPAPCIARAEGEGLEFSHVALEPPEHLLLEPRLRQAIKVSKVSKQVSTWMSEWCSKW